MKKQYYRLKGVMRCAESLLLSTFCLIGFTMGQNLQAQSTGNDCANTEPGSNTGDTGCVSFTFEGLPMSYITVRGADGNVWLQQNLGSESVATALDEEAGYGDLYQWGRWNDGHQKRTSVTTTVLPTPNNPAGIGSGLDAYITGSPAWWAGNDLTDTWTAETPNEVTEVDGCDPCKALGEGWKIPSQDDWAALVEAEDIVNPATAFASTLKLPATGYRSASSGGFTFVGQRGYYWSSTTSSSGAKYLYIGTTLANPAAGASRGQGAAIRCVKLAQQQVQTVTVSTQNNVSAEITSGNAMLQLVATVTPEDANQEVTWSIVSGNELATVDENGLVTAIANGIVTVRATSIADETKYGELDITIITQSIEDCESLTELYENFDEYSCCEMGVVPTCWESIILGGASQIISSTQPASGTSQIYQFGYGTGKISIVVLPQFSNINAGTHQFRFKVKANGGPGTLEFGYITDITDAITFVMIESLTITNSSYNSTDAERILSVPTTVPSNARLAVRNPGTTWAGMYWDDAYWEPISITSVQVTTQNNVPAEITSENGMLQLVATVNPANTSQNVTWGIISGNEFATVDANGLVTAITDGDGTVTVRATSVADATKFDNIDITIHVVLSNEAFDKAGLTLYPNPTDGIIAINAPSELKHFEVFNMAGQRILEGSSKTIDLANIVPGLYMVKIQLDGHKQIVRKIVKE